MKNKLIDTIDKYLGSILVGLGILGLFSLIFIAPGQEIPEERFHLFLFAFGAFFSCIGIAASREKRIELFLLLYTLGLIAMLYGIISDIYNGLLVMLSDPNFMVYIKIIIPIVLIILVYALIIIGNSKNNKILIVPKLLHLALVIYLLFYYV